MRLTYRPATEVDVEESFTKLGGGFAYDAYDRSLRPRVPDILRALIACGAMIGVLLEDLDRPTGAQAVAFGCSVFVSDEFVYEAESSLPPYVRAQVMERILQGRSPVLDPRQIRRAAAGVNLFLIEDILGNRSLSRDELREVRTKGAETALTLYRSYQLRSITNEVYGDEMCQMFVASGASVRRDYAEFFAPGSPVKAPPSDEHPYLAGISREEATARDGTLLSLFFQHTPKRLFFRPVEQELLRGALAGGTDEELASALCISLSAVKKRWKNVYDRVQRIEPTLIVLDGDEPGHPLHARGSEKRRHLLNYLRQHPGELDPNIP